MFSRKGDNNDYNLVLEQRKKLSAIKAEQAFRIFCIVEDFLQQEFCFVKNIEAPCLEYFDPKSSSIPADFSHFFDYYNKFLKKRRTIFELWLIYSYFWA